jgi:hypothetical protein
VIRYESLWGGHATTVHAEAFQRLQMAPGCELHPAQPGLAGGPGYGSLQTPFAHYLLFALLVLQIQHERNALQAAMFPALPRNATCTMTGLAESLSGQCTHSFITHLSIHNAGEYQGNGVLKKNFLQGSSISLLL